MTLVIKPVKLNKSVYVRVPNDLADMIGLTQTDHFSLKLQDVDGEFRLIYTIQKSEPDQTERRIARSIITNQ
jgi:antitoxin component of MazEF toxin-antitoxin module